MPSKVYFTRNIAPESVLKLYEACGLELPGNVAVKLHSGEKGNQNFLPPEFWRSMIERVHGTVVECNTAYPGSRNTTAAHWQTMRDHGWSDAFTVDIMDEEGPDLQLLIPNGKVIQKNYVGKHLTRYDSLLVLSHFKGHPMGGFGGALKSCPSVWHPPTARRTSTARATRKSASARIMTASLRQWRTRPLPSPSASRARPFTST